MKTSESKQEIKLIYINLEHKFIDNNSSTVIRDVIIKEEFLNEIKLNFKEESKIFNEISEFDPITSYLELFDPLLIDLNNKGYLTVLIIDQINSLDSCQYKDFRFLTYLPFKLKNFSQSATWLFS